MSDRGPEKHEKGEFNILPVDEDKKNPPPSEGRHSEGNGPNLRSEFHVGPALMPGAFMGSMGSNATEFERAHFKAKEESK